MAEQGRRMTGDFQIGPAPADPGDAALWIAYEVLSGLLVLASVMVAVLLLFSTTHATVAPSKLAPGTRVEIFQGDNGPEASVPCPSPMAWARGHRRALCEHQERLLLFKVEPASLLSAVVFSVVFLHARRRRRDLARAVDDDTEVRTYIQAGMPRNYWIAIVVVGSFGLLVVGVVVQDILQHHSTNPTGGLFWGVIVYLTVWEYGFRRAY